VEAGFSTTVTLRSRVWTFGSADRGAPLVIALHGQGMTPRALERWLRPGIEATAAAGGGAWWLPRGILPLEIRHRRIGYAWYVFDGDQAKLRTSMDEARAYVVGLAALARRRQASSRITLFGFSQGAYLASYVALNHPDLFGRLVCCCGRPKAEFLADLAPARGLRVLVQTGARDQSVPPELIAKGVDPLREAGLVVEERSYDADHRVTEAMARDAAAFAAAPAAGSAS